VGRAKRRTEPREEELRGVLSWKGGYAKIQELVDEIRNDIKVKNA